MKIKRSKKMGHTFNRACDNKWYVLHKPPGDGCWWVHAVANSEKEAELNERRLEKELDTSGDNESEVAVLPGHRIRNIPLLFPN